MLNIEKYKSEIIAEYRNLLEKTVIDGDGNKMNKAIKIVASEKCNKCLKGAKEPFMWLLEEYTEPILDDKEREYLSSVIEPFRKSIISIKKLEATYGWEIISFYYTFQSYGCITILPPFQSGTRFKGMELGKEYMCEELGL